MYHTLSSRTRVLEISLVAIASAFIVEMVFGITENSLALITDSIHALLDVFVTIILLIAVRMALKPPDAEHTYGHGKVESLGGLLGGIAILLIACFFIYEALTRIQSPPQVLPGLYAVIAGVYTIGVDIFRIVLLKKVIKSVGGVTLKADFYHAFMDLGSTLVAIAGIVLVYYGFTSGDFIAALILGGLLVALSIKLVYKTALDLTDVISPAMVKRVKEITTATRDVIDVEQVLMRRSGDIIFADITITLNADVTFDQAHDTASRVEENIKEIIPNLAVTIHFEPSWKGIPPTAKILEIAQRVQGVRGVHNVSTHKTRGKMFSDLHVMVDRDIDLKSAHKISETVEEDIHSQIPEIEHTTIHLEPHVTIPDILNIEDADAHTKIESILSSYSQVRRVGRIVSLRFENMQKIDIDCSFDGNTSIEEIHDLTSEIEQQIRTQIRNAVITIHPEPE